MKALPIVVAVLAVVVVLRLGRLRRNRHRSGAVAATAPLSTSTAAPRVRDRRLLGDMGLVAGREIRERLRGRVFRAVTIVLFAVVAAAVIIPTLHGGNGAKRQTVGVIAGTAPLHAELRQVAQAVGLSVRVVPEPDLRTAKGLLVDKKLAMVVDGERKILVLDPLSDADVSLEARYVRAVSTTLGVQEAFANAGLTPLQAATVARAKPLSVQSLHPAKKERTTSEATGLLGVILIFIVLTQYLTWTLMGVMEEKASRVVEVLLATVRPIELLAGKVVGIGAVALAQAGALVAFALVLASAVGSSLVRGSAPVVVGATLVWLVLGYAFYSWLYAAAGSLAERQDQVQSLALPLSAPLVFGYIASITGATSGSPSLLVKVLAYLPPTAPFAVPTLVGFGDLSWWQFLLSALVSVASTVGVALAASRVYRRAVLRTGGRVRLRDLMPRLAGVEPGTP